jgi:hypothetical protein
MPITHSTLEVQLGSFLRVFQKRRATIEEMRLATSTKDRGLLNSVVTANSFSPALTDEAPVLSALSEQFERGSIPAMRRLLKSEIDVFLAKFGKMVFDDESASKEDRSVATIKYFYDDVDGAISISERRGLWGVLYRAMQRDSESVLKSTAAVGSITVVTGSRGILAKGVGTALSNAEPGTLRVTVVSDNVTKPILKAVLEFTDPWWDGTTELAFDNQFTTDKQVEDGPTGITLRLDRSGLTSPTELTDTAAAFSSCSFATPKSGDSDHGVFHIRVTRLASDVWQVEAYADSSHESLVGTPNAAVSGTSGTQVLTIPMKNGTVQTVTVDKSALHSAAPTVGDVESASWDIETPRLGDQFTLPITNDEAGSYQTKLKDMGMRIALPEVAASNTYAEAGAASVTYGS